MNAMHEIEYKIFGEDLQYVEIELDPQEAVVAEAGGMMFLEEGIEMETIFGDGSAQSQAGGFMGALMGAGKRLLTGESLFMTVFQNRGAGKRRVAFGAPYPGRIVPVHLAEVGGELIVQKDAFLAAAAARTRDGVDVRITCVDLTGRTRVFTVCADTLYWPTTELRRDADGAAWSLVVQGRGDGGESRG